MIKNVLKIFTSLVISGVIFASCLQKEDTMAQYEYQIQLDSEAIEYFMRTNKVVYTEVGDTASLQKCEFDDPNCIWNKRLNGDGVLTKDTPYNNLIDKVFKDTILERVITAKEDGTPDTLYLPTGTWVFISNKGAKAERPDTSSYALVRYAGFLTNHKDFDYNYIGQSFAVGKNEYGSRGTILGFANGLQYFEPGRLVTEIETDSTGKEIEKIGWADTGSGWILIPSRSAYGNTYNGDIPPNSVLIFQVSLLAISQIPPTENQETNAAQNSAIWLNFHK